MDFLNMLLTSSSARTKTGVTDNQMIRSLCRGTCRGALIVSFSTPSKRYLTTLL